MVRRRALPGAFEPDGNFTLQVGKDNWPLPYTHSLTRGKLVVLGWASRQREYTLPAYRSQRAGGDQCVQRDRLRAARLRGLSAHDGKPAGSYAGRLVSEPGKQNGLYWEVKDGEAESPAGPMLAQAANEGYDTSGNRTPYHGYYYRMLPRRQWLRLRRLSRRLSLQRGHDISRLPERCDLPKRSWR